MAGLACVALSLTELILARENFRLRAIATTRIAELQAGVGTALPALRGRDYAGRRVVVAYGPGQPRATLLFVFTLSCDLCAQSWAQMRSLEGGAPPGVRIVGVDLHPDFLTEQFLASHGLQGKVVFAGDIDPEDYLAYHFSLVPQTILISREGRVLWVKTGALEPRTVRECLYLLTSVGA